jgi:transcriptional regulator of acetoin/glycerol metabolism
MDGISQTESWKLFVETQRLDTGVSPVIAASWKRCWTRINPYQSANLTQLSAEHLLAAQVNAFDYMSLARPIMEDISQAIEKTETAMILVNSAGFVLDILGDAEMVERLGRMGIKTGSDLSESRLGTNAFGLALTDRIPSQVVGPQHYLLSFHELAESAAPIFDLSGRPLGALGLVTMAEKHNSHILGLAVAGARAVEGQRQSEYLLAEQNSHLAQLNAILAANSEGVLVWNAEHVWSGSTRQRSRC